MDSKSDYLNFLHSNKKMFHGDNHLVVVGFYKFFELNDLNDFQVSLKSIFLSKLQYLVFELSVLKINANQFPNGPNKYPPPKM